MNKNDWNDVKAKQLDMFMPLYDIQWIRENIVVRHEEYSNGCNDQVLECIEDLKSCVGIMIGKPDKECYNETFMFGLKYDDGSLDDCSYIDFLTEILFAPLIEVDLFDNGVSESCSGFNYDSVGVSIKEVQNVVSTVLGKCLSDPNVVQQRITTDVIKNFLADSYGIDVKSLKRGTKSKFGVIDVREFIDTDTDSTYTVMDFEGRIISCHDFSY